MCGKLCEPLRSAEWIPDGPLDVKETQSAEPRMSVEQIRRLVVPNVGAVRVAGSRRKELCRDRPKAMGLVAFASGYWLGEC
jgi:hypothetical protein